MLGPFKIIVSAVGASRALQTSFYSYAASVNEAAGSWLQGVRVLLLRGRLGHQGIEPSSRPVRMCVRCVFLGLFKNIVLGLEASRALETSFCSYRANLS